MVCFVGCRFEYNILLWNKEVIINPDSGYVWRVGDRVMMQDGNKETDGAISFVIKLFPAKRWGVGPNGDSDSHWVLLANGWMIRPDLCFNIDAYEKDQMK